MHFFPAAVNTALVVPSYSAWAVLFVRQALGLFPLCSLDTVQHSPESSHLL